MTVPYSLSSPARIVQLRIVWMRASAVSAFSAAIAGLRITPSQALHGLHPNLVPSWASSKLDALSHLTQHPSAAHLCLRSLMSGIRRSMSLPDWHMLAPMSDQNPYRDKLAPSASPEVEDFAPPSGGAGGASADGLQSGRSVFSGSRNGGGAKQPCWRWHLDCADSESGEWRCLLSDRDMFVALRAMLRRQTRDGGGAAPPPPSDGGQGSLDLSGATAVDARLRRSRVTEGLDLRLRVVVGPRCQRVEPLPSASPTGMGKVVSAFLSAPAPTIPSHLPPSATVGMPRGVPGIRRVFLPSPEAAARAASLKAEAALGTDGGGAAASAVAASAFPTTDDFLSPEVLLVPSSKLLERAPVSVPLPSSSPVSALPRPYES